MTPGVKQKIDHSKQSCWNGNIWAKTWKSSEEGIHANINIWRKSFQAEAGLLEHLYSLDSNESKQLFWHLKFCLWCFLGNMYVLHASPSRWINISHLKRKWFRKQPWGHSYPAPWCFPVSLLAFSPTAVTLTSDNLGPAQQLEWHWALRDGHNIFVRNDMQITPRDYVSRFFSESKKRQISF